jgi:hypothetical protein
MLPIIVTSLDSRDNVQRQVRRYRRRGNFVYYIEYFRKAAGILPVPIILNQAVGYCSGNSVTINLIQNNVNSNQQPDPK